MIPRATYRLQFREGTDFDAAARLAPYLARLGVSHLYASPLFQASPGSTHGYDVTDHTRFDDSLGGIDGFLRMSEALKAHGLGLILDIVPNHMAASPHNPWWRDVLRHGRDSAYAGHFDIDWGASKLLIPTLGQPYGAALEAGELGLGLDFDGLTLTYYEHAFPLDPASWSPVLATLGGAAPSEPDGFVRWLAERGNADALAPRLAALSADRTLLHRLHEAQAWRLCHWRAARDMLTYRRFFEIADLIGVRVEEPAVFDDVHRFLFGMVDAGHVQGLRVDHVDGLADPAGYLDRLAAACPGVPIWVEKILGPDEELPARWPVAGTTGYEFAEAVGDVLTDPAAEAPLDAAYADFIGEELRYRPMLRAAKREILTRNLAAELDLLAALAVEAAADDLMARDWGPDTLRRALVAFMAAMPVYRTYLDGSPPDPDARALLDGVVAEASRHTELDDPAPIALVARLLSAPDAARFRTRMQQTTGALMAKAVEDTLFYRYNRLLSANEVGAEPGELGESPGTFHARMARRAARQPAGLSATATHDTKRGEDARMRIAAISEAPGAWADAVRRFDGMLGAGGDPNTRWLFYQALLGAWEPEDDALADRLAAYLVKAERERKRHTSWVAPDPDYEARLEDLAHRAVDSRRFRDAFAAEAAPFLAIGARKCLVQTALKLTLPGIPDIYQGTELADLSFVDPDNRRPVDWERRAALLETPVEEAEGEERKMALLRFGLALRRDHPALFEAPCRPLPAEGRILAFERRAAGRVLRVVADLTGRFAGGPCPEALPDPLLAFPAGPAGAALADASVSLTLART